MQDRDEDILSYHSNKGRDVCALCGAELDELWKHNGLCPPCTMARLETWRKRRKEENSESDDHTR